MNCLSTFQRQLSSHLNKVLLRVLSSSKEYNHINVSKHFPDLIKPPGLGVGLITLNKPKSLNALSDALYEDLIHACKSFDSENNIGSIVITGRGKAFAAGADITEMRTKKFAEAYKANMFVQWADISKISKPIIAAVNGFALGGGCELAMMCDIIIASNEAKFGQPEINLGIIPGAGGTQRLIRSIGKSKSMEMILTGSMISSKQAEKDGLISRVVEENDDLVLEALKIGYTIGQKGQVSIQMAKEAINAANEMTLEQGLNFERRLFHSLFSTRDQKIGMESFVMKEVPNFTHN